jgi:hypothetical protein
MKTKFKYTDEPIETKIIRDFLPQMASKKQGFSDLWQSGVLQLAFGSALHLNAFGWQVTAAVKPCSSLPVGCD